MRVWVCNLKKSHILFSYFFSNFPLNYFDNSHFSIFPVIFAPLPPVMAVAAIDIYNGERFVVFIFVSSILYSTPFSLLYEAVGICLLAVAGFVLEVAVERCSVSFDRFSIRLVNIYIFHELVMIR